MTTNESAGATVKIESVATLLPSKADDEESATPAPMNLWGENAAVLNDESPEKNAAIYFVGGPENNAAYDGKVFIRFDWLNLSRTTGNVGFVNLINPQYAHVFGLCFVSNQTDLIIVGETEVNLPLALANKKPARIDIVIDIAQWSYVLSLNGTKMAAGGLTTCESKSFWRIGFGTSSAGISRFAIDNVTISAYPIKK